MQGRKKTAMSDAQGDGEKIEAAPPFSDYGQCAVGQNPRMVQSKVIFTMK